MALAASERIRRVLRPGIEVPARSVQHVEESSQELMA